MTVYNIMGVDIPGYPPSVDARLPITPSRFLSGVLPAFLVHYLTAVLVCRPNTRALRLTLLPISLPLAWIAATRYDMAAGKDEYSHMNYGICVSCISLWTLKQLNITAFVGPHVWNHDAQL